MLIRALYSGAAAAPPLSRPSANRNLHCLHTSPRSLRAKETVNIRSAHTTSATALGTWGKGKKGSICTTDGKPVKGGTYTACGKKSNGWFYGGPYGSDISGWVPATCIP
ncbi:hypothetical protein [Streptomyces sp. NPDC001537]